MWQVIIHLTFVLSAMAMAFTNRLMDESLPSKQHERTATMAG
jgi:uncharacterized membrane protein YqhA